MHLTTNPITGAILSLVLILAGWFMATNGSGTSAVFGWGFLVVGALSGVFNVALVLRRRR